jgi:hypothetical protein
MRIRFIEKDPRPVRSAVRIDGQINLSKRREKENRYCRE